MNAFDTRPNLPDILAAEWSQQDMAIAASRHRAADASHSSLLRVSTIGGIAIAAIAALYFIAEFLR